MAAGRRNCGRDPQRRAGAGRHGLRDRVRPFRRVGALCVDCRARRLRGVRAEPRPRARARFRADCVDRGERRAARARQCRACGCARRCARVALRHALSGRRSIPARLRHGSALHADPLWLSQRHRRHDHRQPAAEAARSDGARSGDSAATARAGNGRCCRQNEPRGLVDRCAFACRDPPVQTLDAENAGRAGRRGCRDHRGRLFRSGGARRYRRGRQLAARAADTRISGACLERMACTTGERRCHRAGVVDGPQHAVADIRVAQRGARRPQSRIRGARHRQYCSRSAPGLCSCGQRIAHARRRAQARRVRRAA
ncbi:hypothetical protein UA18_02271 [Burkholderia multivorans]|uniref:Uncharacterized protein n=1 Tax=Burkholderia multivorans TaxID=87883 RepID=A0ABD7LK14_9BURK|nr:hypothetical protein [Burkholderia multivorans]MDR8805555.1 hypothetical protein [Burkholderia multivorans]SAK19668.1 hypothetical protein UA18_02271 [Burkholderia multivorans]SAK22369.1 hypothetical protein UA17_02469 [Burkholderia multivorans]